MRENVVALLHSLHALLQPPHVIACACIIDLYISACNVMLHMQQSQANKHANLHACTRQNTYAARSAALRSLSLRLRSSFFHCCLGVIADCAAELLPRMPMQLPHILRLQRGGVASAVAPPCYLGPMLVPALRTPTAL